MYIKINIKTAPMCFGAVTSSSGSALFVLTKVTVVKTVHFLQIFAVKTSVNSKPT